MKKWILFCLLIPGSLIQAQSFHRGAVVFDISTGIDVFNTTRKYQTNDGYDTIVNGTSANKNLSAAVEIGLGKRIGIGAKGRINSFFSEVDKVIQEKTLANSADLLVNLNIHPIVREHLDVILGAEVGASTIDLNFGDSKKLVTSGKGGYAAFYLNPRIYWGRFGVNFRASLPIAQYRNLSTVRESSVPARYDLAYWQGIGVGFSVGVQVRLF